MKIQSKLLLSILSSVIVIMIAVIYINKTYSEKIMVGEIEKYAKSMLDSYSNELNDDIASLQDVAQGLAFSVEALKPESEDQIKDLIKKFLNSASDAFGSTIAFEPGVFHEKEYFAPYYYKTKDGIKYKNLIDPKYNYPKLDWYRIPKETGKPFWTNPYEDVGGGNVVMMTYSYPLFNDGVFLGVATVDVAIKDLTDIIEAIKVAKTGYAFLISKDGTIISSRAEDWKLKKNIIAAEKKSKVSDMEMIGKRMLSGEKGFVLTEEAISGVPAWYAFGAIPLTGWSLGIVFPKDELLADLTKLSRHIIIMWIGGILLISIIIIINYFV